MMEAGALPLEVDDEGRALQHQGSSTGSGSSSGTPYYNHKNGKWLCVITILPLLLLLFSFKGQKEHTMDKLSDTILD